MEENGKAAKKKEEGEKVAKEKEEKEKAAKEKEQREKVAKEKEEKEKAAKENDVKENAAKEKEEKEKAVKENEQREKAAKEKEEKEKAAKEKDERDNSLMKVRTYSSSPVLLGLSLSSTPKETSTQREISEKIFELLKESFDLVEAAVQLDCSHNYGKDNYFSSFKTSLITLVASFVLI